MNDLTILQVAKDSYNDLTFCVSELEVLIKEVDGVQIIAIRGTEVGGDALWKEGGWRDVLRDLRFGVRFWHGLRGHAGILRGAKDILHLCKVNLDKDKPVVITGHSLGGGVALPLGIMLAKDDYVVTDIVTAGAPKVLSRGFKQFKNTHVRQYIYKGDPVPRLPFFKLFRRHVNAIQLGKKVSRNWKDHALENYLYQLKTEQTK